MLALSTSWNNDFKKSAKEVVQEIKNLGFDYIELAFSHTLKEVSQIYKNRDNCPKLISLHNFCPIPEEISREQALPDCYSLSSPIASERKRAIELTKRTLLWAKKFKAKTVVLHTGRVQILDYTRQLIKLKIKKNANSCEFDSLRELAIKEREDNKAEFLNSVFKSIRELSEFANNVGIGLGIENRIYINEIPNFNEINLFLDNFSKKGVCYWHDTGHAYILEKLGFARQLDYLKKYKKYLCGIHLHDVKDFTDHRAPFTGEIDFTMLIPYIKNDTIKVIEAHRPATREEIILSKQKLEKLFKNHN